MSFIVGLFNNLPQCGYFLLLKSVEVDLFLKSIWKDVLLLVELLFCLPISNAIVEHFLSLQNRVKTDGRASLGEKRLNSLLRICTEGPECEHFDATKAMNMWANNVIRRLTQNVRKTYTPRPVKENSLHWLIYLRVVLVMFR